MFTSPARLCHLFQSSSSFPEPRPPLSPHNAIYAMLLGHAADVVVPQFVPPVAHTCPYVLARPNDPRSWRRMEACPEMPPNEDTSGWRGLANGGSVSWRGWASQRGERKAPELRIYSLRRRETDDDDDGGLFWYPGQAAVRYSE